MKGAAGQAGERGLVTSLANPKLAVSFIALFPQFPTRGTPVLVQRVIERVTAAVMIGLGIRLAIESR